ncbi:MAG: EAL domain-containing protein [Campylobacterota bacterium]|nr:EAL domain-containing protein [Campylobacterota bacterium]
MKNFTVSFITIEELKKILKNSIIKDSQSTLIQIFYANTNIDSIKEVQLFFKENYPASVVLGTTTDGVLESTAVYNDTKSVVTFTSFDETTLKTILLESADYNNDSFIMGQAIANQLSVDDTKSIITFTDGININGEEYLNGISSINSEVIVSGGLAADNGKLKKTYVFDKDTISSNGVIGVSLNSQSLNVRTSYNFDWLPIGKKMLVTKAIKNRIYEIDGIPAVEIYAKYMGDELANRLPQTGIEYPLVFEEDGVSIGRAVLFRHDDNSLTFAGNIEEGTLIRFGIGNIEMIIKNSDAQLKSMCEKFKYKPEAIFIYSCMARRRFMKEHIEDDLKATRNLGEISGFFTYGEFFSSKNKNQLLNESMTILALSEKTDLMNCKLCNTSGRYELNMNKEQIIAHLANTVSNELAELNENLEQRVKESSDLIFKQAYFDKLTGLPNRNSLINQLENTNNGVLFLINIDGFTVINDFYGYAIGDKILKRLALILEKKLSCHKVKIFKLPSDEFVLVMDMEKNKKNIEDKIKKINYIVENDDFLIDDNSIHVTVSVSASCIDKNNTSLKDVEISLKLAKKLGKDFLIFDEELREVSQSENNVKMANIIKNAIASDGIIPYFQPIYDAKTGKIEKYECLVRLKKENGDVLAPGAFLDISQTIKLYSSITEIMIEKTFSYFSKNGFNFSVNLSFSDILNKKTRKYIFDKIIEHDIGKQLTIEILETQEIENDSRVETFIAEVYSHGAKIAIDDFGSGFANFEHMTSIDSDYMKIDGSLIKNIDVDENARLVVETIILFAKKLNKKTVAEFVHTKQVENVVKELGIDYVQGSYLGVPQDTVV